MTDHVVGVTGGQFAHEGHGNEVDRQHDVTTRRRSTIKVEAKAKLPLEWEPVSGSEPIACRLKSMAPCASGRGWAVLEEDGSLRGRIFFHLGGDSRFTAVRQATEGRF